MEDQSEPRQQHIYTPSELNREAKLHLEAGFPRILLEAEISNLARPASGHLYFSLKDANAQIRCAMFRSAAGKLKLQPENGKKVVARGRISLYEARGEYQFIVDGLRDAGEGLLQRQFEELKKQLESEGLFDPRHKQALPRFPLRIGVITSPSGAAIRDILHVLGRRWPVAEVRIYAVSVQGAEAPGEIQAALRSANRENWAELLILGRGGGSLEDLQAFNSEAVARALFDSTLPVVSAVGHETDFSISDFVADVRAPTPSAAAEVATPDCTQLKETLSRQQRLLLQRMRGRLQQDMQRLDYLQHRLVQRDPALRLQEQRRQLDALRQGLARAVNARIHDAARSVAQYRHRLMVQHPAQAVAQWRQRLLTQRQAAERLLHGRLEQERKRLRELARTLQAVSPLATVARGYAVISDAASGAVVSSIKSVQAGSGVVAQLRDGRLHCTVDAVSPQTLEQAAPATPTDPA